MKMLSPDLLTLPGLPGSCPHTGLRARRSDSPGQGVRLDAMAAVVVAGVGPPRLRLSRTCHGHALGRCSSPASVLYQLTWPGPAGVLDDVAAYFRDAGRNGDPDR
jgi:hypothetical protein